jgi:hypothetical protein
MLKQDRGEVKEIVDEKVGTWLDGVPVPEEIGEVTVEAPTNDNADEETAAETLADDNADGETAAETPADDNADEETAAEIRRRLKGKQKMYSILDPPLTQRW